MLKDEIVRIQGMKKMIIISVVTGALGAILTGFKKYVVAIRIKMKVEHALKATLLGQQEF